MEEKEGREGAREKEMRMRVKQEEEEGEEGRRSGK